MAPFIRAHVAVVIRAPHVDGLVKATHRQFVVMVGDVGGKVGGDAVGTHQHLVLGLVLVLALVGRAVLLTELGAAVHDGAVLRLVASAAGQQFVHHGLHRSAVVQGALPEPNVVGNAVLGQIPLQPGDVLGQGKVDQGLLAGLLVGGHPLVALLIRKGPGQNLDVLALVAVLRQGRGLLAHKDLLVAHAQALAELLDLVARVVHVELTGHVAAGPVQHRGQAVTQRAAPGVAQVHGAGGVGGNKLHVHLLALAPVGAAVLFVQGSGVDGAGVGPGAQVHVQKAGAGDLHPVHGAVRQVGQMGQDGLRDLAGGLFEHPGAGHGQVAGHVAVFRVGGDLHDEVRQFHLGQVACRHGGLGGLGQQGPGLVQAGLAGVVVLVGLFHLGNQFIVLLLHVSFPLFI